MNDVAAIAACEQIADISVRLDAVYGQIRSDMAESQRDNAAMLARWREEDARAQIHTIEDINVAAPGRVAL